MITSLKREYTRHFPQLSSHAHTVGCVRDCSPASEAPKAGSRLFGKAPLDGLDLLRLRLTLRRLRPTLLRLRLTLLRLRVLQLRHLLHVPTACTDRQLLYR